MVPVFIVLLGSWLGMTSPVPRVIPGAAQVADPFEWETIGTEQGLPSERVFAVAVGESCLWAGTEAGLARVTGDEIQVFGVEEGLPFPAVSALAVDPATDDLWIGTLGGLAHYSGGRIEAFTQLDSGLVNDVVYGIAIDGTDVWIATAAGLNRFDQRTRSWEVFDVSNTLMHEPWCYAVAADGGDVYVAIWGGGIVVRDGKSGVFREHRDPDGEMEIDLYREDGLVHDVTSSVCLSDGIMWAGTYFGLSRFDGRRWNSFNQEDSGLVNDFINQLTTDGRFLWVSTDGGLSRLDVESGEWFSWSRATPGGPWSLTVTSESGSAESIELSEGPASATIFGAALEPDGVWLATGRGLTHGRSSARALQGGF